MRFVVIALMAFAGCTPRPQFQCSEDVPCTRVGEVCVEGQCEEARCASSSQCPMETYCDAGDCLPGCREDEDCLPGSTCDLELAECVEEECTSTVVDCGYREFCNAA